MADTSRRSITKAASWRIFAIILLATVTYAYTRDLSTVTWVTLGYHSLQLFMFFLHERIWNGIEWGKTRGLFIQMTGLSGAGKTTLSRVVADRLKKKGIHVELIDGDEYRTGLCSDLGFSKEDRNTNIRRLGFVSKILARNNVVSIIAAINPYDEVRQELKKMSGSVMTVHIDCDIDTLITRDTKGLYRRALLPIGHPDRVDNFTGISDPYEAPSSPDLKIDTSKTNMEDSANKLEDFILRSIS